MQSLYHNTSSPQSPISVELKSIYTRDAPIDSKKMIMANILFENWYLQTGWH